MSQKITHMKTRTAASLMTGALIFLAAYGSVYSIPLLVASSVGIGVLLGYTLKRPAKGVITV